MEKDQGLSQGCPGVAQLRALADGRAGEETRGTLAAHLAGCDSCLARYLALVEEEPLLAPAGTPAAAVEARLGRRTGRRRNLKLIALIATAACLAMTLWGFGAAAAAHQQKADPGATTQPGLTRRLDAAADGLADAFNGFFGALGSGTDTGKT